MGRALAQFFVLFAGPIGLVLLTGYVVLRWLGVSLRRSRPEPAERPELRVLEGGRRDGPREEAP